MTLTAPSLIDMQEATYVVDGKTVLSGITLRTDARRIGVVGRNGSGKTTFARMLAGLVAPDSGTVRIAGVDVARDRKAALECVGILFQNPDHQIIFPTVEEEIAFGLTQLGRAQVEVQQAVTAMLARFDKKHWAKVAIHQLSQGQRQLVCLMSVLAMAPRVIVLDEPFAGLDIPTTRQLARLLQGLDVTLVLITHDPAILRGYDQVLWIDGGQIVNSGEAAPVLAAFDREMMQLGDGDDLSDLAG
ncbi:ABC transporter ATP-binding protein [Sulfitobacter sp. F26204]|uniref:energy-coupling factor ABC transporter ATP-binding protein n=1 Tax=Sulfitobacter sp. F26204 TaxID=2996014 RepID=UPI00225E1378|nr:ABC transporter ATP-binding protein [Sulfitobacter sp. F26204]MCX7558555.1 ABC transporter ATP-binding protein [Sulfitobacter sp. F26204]